MCYKNLRITRFDGSFGFSGFSLCLEYLAVVTALFIQTDHDPLPVCRHEPELFQAGKQFVVPDLSGRPGELRFRVQGGYAA